MSCRETNHPSHDFRLGQLQPTSCSGKATTRTITRFIQAHETKTNMVSLKRQTRTRSLSSSSRTIHPTATRSHSSSACNSIRSNATSPCCNTGTSSSASRQKPWRRFQLNPMSFRFSLTTTRTNATNVRLRLSQGISLAHLRLALAISHGSRAKDSRRNNSPRPVSSWM